MEGESEVGCGFGADKPAVRPPGFKCRADENGEQVGHLGERTGRKSSKKVPAFIARDAVVLDHDGNQ